MSKKVNVIVVNGVEYNVPEETLKSITVICEAFGTKVTKVSTTKDQPKVTTKPQPKPQKQTSKKSDGFDRAKYEVISREFGCWSEKRNTCYKKCRDLVYKVMNGELTKAKGKAEVKKILATEYGIK